MRRRVGAVTWRGQRVRARLPGEDAEATTIEDRPRQFRAWYGLPGEIVVESNHWHLVKVGPLPLPHSTPREQAYSARAPSRGEATPELLARTGTSSDAAAGPCKRRLAVACSQPAAEARVSRLIRLAAAFVSHEAAWEFASETYVVTKSGQRCRRLHREYPHPLRPAFWVGMAGLALVGTVFSVWKQSQR